MTEQPFREIQLSGKQLIFLFMLSVVLAVSVFLLGVSVGRGVRNAADPSVDVSAASDTTVPTAVPPPTQTKQGELTYHDQLQGGAAPAGAAPKPGQTPPAPPPETPPAAAAPAPKPSEPTPTKPAAEKPVAA